MATTTETGYELEGSLLEACSCGVLCPCWIGEDPDHGACEAVNAYHFDTGTIRGVDVSGLSFVTVHRIPGNVLAGNWRAVWFISDEASDEQLEAIRDAFAGELGGPLGDLAGLYGEVLEVKRAPIVHETRAGAGTLRIGEAVSSEMHPYTAPDGSTTTLRDSLFSTVPGSPAYVSKADYLRVNLPEYDYVWSFEGRNAIQADWRLVHSEPA
ncbi:MAG: DUF1326 domain-containing protein [Gaiellaceae bacterium]